MKSLVLRYGEINLKGKNRSFFERSLMASVKQKVLNYETKIQRLRNRIIIDIQPQDEEELYKSFLKLPGIENISLALRTQSDYNSIKDTVLEVFDRTTPCFRVSTKRSNKDFEYTSQELSKRIGGEILKANDGLTGLQVSLKDFKQEIGIEILQDYTYIFHKKIQAMGGLPIGSGGRGLVLLSGGIDSPVAAIEAMKRGIKIDCVHFSTPPYTTKGALQKVQTIVEILQKYDANVKLFNFNITAVQLEIKKNCIDKYTLLLMRRIMYRKASDYAVKNNYKMLLTGESIGQVASQTIESITMTNMVSLVPVIRPLITHNKNEIIQKAKRYETYETSIIPFEDACTVFAPKRPETKPRIEDILKEEEKFNYQKFLEEIKLENNNIQQENIENYL
ncbi:MAG: tRNA uracil 4-sulfurtransferase ThiI [Mycoplasmatales bacterium]